MYLFYPQNIIEWWKKCEDLNFVKSDSAGCTIESIDGDASQGIIYVVRNLAKKN